MFFRLRARSSGSAKVGSNVISLEEPQSLDSHPLADHQNLKLSHHPSSGVVQFAQEQPHPFVIPKPGLSARNLLAPSRKTADSPRDNTALRNDNPLWELSN
jgi:hypothetical protein